VELAALYVKRLGTALPEDAGALEAALRSALQAARRAHPKSWVEDAAFVWFLADRAGPRALEAGGGLEHLFVADLYLACACLAGNREAITALDEQILHPASAGARRIGGTADFADEVHQQLRERLLVPERGQPARLSEYGGTGSLLGWAKVTASRLALNMRSAPAREVSLEAELLPGAAHDPEHSVIGRRNAERLAAAFKEATATLGSEERVLLRYHFADGLNFEQIAGLFQTHRSTVSRKIAAARRKLLAETRRLLRERFGIQQRELSSVIRTAQSRLDGTITAWLRAP
jgi:RNA polymerase sigma-70 factor (ECF subfamily)